MGGKTKQTTTNDPSAYAQPYVTGAASALGQGYQQSNGMATQAATSLYPGALGNAQGGAGTLGAANTYAGNVLSGQYLNSNPNMQGMIAQTGNDVADRINALFSQAGRTGSSTHAYDLAKGLGEAENQLQYTDYNNQLGRMDAMAQLSPQLSSQGLSALTGTVGLPQSLASQYASGIGALMGNYNTSNSVTQKQPGALDYLGTGLQIASLFA